MLFPFSQFSFLPPPLSLSPKPFSFSHQNYFCQITLRVLLYHSPFFPFSQPFSLPFFPLYVLTLILLQWALVNSDWFTRHSLFDFFPFVFLPLLTPSFSSTLDTLQEVVRPVFAALSNYALVPKISTGTALHA